jgi:hypothetical protein
VHKVCSRYTLYTDFVNLLTCIGTRIATDTAVLYGPRLVCGGIASAMLNPRVWTKVTSAWYNNRFTPDVFKELGGPQS